MSNSGKRIPELEIPEIQNDSKAIEESVAFANETDLAKSSRIKDHNLRQSLKEYFFIILKILLACIILALIMIGLVLIFHMIAPSHWQWLSEKQLCDPQKNLTSGILAVFATEYAKKYL